MSVSARLVLRMSHIVNFTVLDLFLFSSCGLFPQVLDDVGQEKADPLKTVFAIELR